MAKELRRVEADGRQLALRRYFRLAYSQSLSQAWRTWQIASALATDPEELAYATEAHAEVKRLINWQAAREAKMHERQMEALAKEARLAAEAKAAEEAVTQAEEASSVSMLEQTPSMAATCASEARNGTAPSTRRDDVLPPPQLRGRAAQMLEAWKRENEKAM